MPPPSGLSNPNFSGRTAHLGDQDYSVKALRALVLIALLILIAGPAFAHDEAEAAGGVAAGFSHPFFGVDHMLAMIAVGIWGAFLGRPLLIVLPMLFPVMMTAGAAVAMAGIPAPAVETGIAVSVVILGALILAAIKLPAILACGIVAIFALFHGYAHGIELPSTADPVGYSVGFVVATGLLHLFGIALGLLQSLGWGKIALRSAGGAIALVGAALLIGGLRG